MIWNNWIKLVTEVSKQIGLTYQPDIIVPAMNGGLIPATIISVNLQIKDIRPISVGRRQRRRHLIYPELGDIGNLRHKKILIVEDDALTGLSFDFIKKLLLQKGAAEVRTVCIFKYKDLSGIDYYARAVKKFPCYPWKKPHFGDRAAN
ncbi:MAG: phosphoribosyltransferase family protein [Candidatus Magasanikbacteria bacterium]